jgi:hypothetical protein
LGFVANLRHADFDPLRLLFPRDGRLKYQMLQLVGTYVNRRLETVAAHVDKKAVEHLPGDGILVELVLQINAANKHPAVEHFCFKNKTQFACGKPVVNHLYSRMQIGW